MKRLRQLEQENGRLKRLVAIDAYGESEHLGVPFETTLLGVPVTVTRVDVTERDEIVAICSRGRLRQSIPISAKMATLEGFEPSIFTLKG